MSDDKFEKFWGRVWASLFNILGIVFVLGFIALIVWGIFQPETELNSKSRQQAQNSFNAALLSAKTPCTKKIRAGLDLSQCSIFGLRPGMRAEQAVELINSTGYFRTRKKTSPCSKKDACSHELTLIKDGFYIRVAFQEYPDHSEQVRKIILSFDSGSHPYFDPELIKSIFLKILGPPNVTLERHLIWNSTDGLSIRVYIYEEALWVIYEQGDGGEPERTEPA